MRPYRLADTESAIENVSPVSGTISGPTDIVSEGTYHWQVTAAGAEGSSSFELRATGGLAWTHAVGDPYRERFAGIRMMRIVNPSPEASVMGLWSLSEGTGKAYPGGS